MELFNFNFDEIFKNLIQLLVALVLPLLVAWDREADNKSRTAGLRTFPLVSMAACGFTILATSIFGENQPQAKVLSSIVGGIGFIGGGAILKGKSHVTGVSTAAAIWATGAIGIAVGLGRIEIAIVLSVMTFLTFRVIGIFK